MKNPSSMDVFNFGIKLKKAARIVFFVFLCLGITGILISLIVALSEHLVFYRFMIPFFISAAQILFAPIAYFSFIVLSYHFIGIGITAINAETLAYNANPGINNSNREYTAASDNSELPDL